MPPRPALYDHRSQRRCACHWVTMPLTLHSQDALCRCRHCCHRQHPRPVLSHPQNRRRCACHRGTTLLQTHCKHLTLIYPLVGRDISPLNDSAGQFCTDNSIGKSEPTSADAINRVPTSHAMNCHILCNKCIKSDIHIIIAIFLVFGQLFIT